MAEIGKKLRSELCNKVLRNELFPTKKSSKKRPKKEIILPKNDFKGNGAMFEKKRNIVEKTRTKRMQHNSVYVAKKST